MFPQKIPDIETMKQILLWISAISFVSSSVAVIGRTTTEAMIKTFKRKVTRHATND